MLKNKKVLIGVTGSIAAYKIATLIRLLKKQEAEVKVIMTASASEFITPLTLSTLSDNEVLSDFVKDKTGKWNNHVELALWADVFLIAPASMNTIGKIANGICDNLLLATYFSAKCPVIIAPAMDLDMYAHPTNQTNLTKLKQHNNLLIDATSGELASGLIGKGRMEEPENILTFLNQYFSNAETLSGKNVLITAGPTVEQIDPVRFISNNSTGKMGFAIAEKALQLGANVTIISGPVAIKLEHKNLTIIKVKTAAEMYENTLNEAIKYDFGILTAAVADYTPKEVATTKIKKKTADLTLELTKTKDIAAALGKLKTKKQILVGFALETNNEKQNALEKLEKKNLDAIVLNSLNDTGAGFGNDTNKISILSKDNKIVNFELKSKKEVASDIWDFILKLK